LLDQSRVEVIRGGSGRSVGVMFDLHRLQGG
jgi:hypothetical protein